MLNIMLFGVYNIKTAICCSFLFLFKKLVVELKVVELNSSHIGQIEKYMNYIDKNIKTIEENKTIGIIICKKDNKYVIKYSSDERILSRKYTLV